MDFAAKTSSVQAERTGLSRLFQSRRGWRNSSHYASRFEPPTPILVVSCKPLQTTAFPFRVAGPDLPPIGPSRGRIVHRDRQPLPCPTTLGRRHMAREFFTRAPWADARSSNHCAAARLDRPPSALSPLFELRHQLGSSLVLWLLKHHPRPRLVEIETHAALLGRDVGEVDAELSLRIHQVSILHRHAHNVF